MSAAINDLQVIDERNDERTAFVHAMRGAVAGVNVVTSDGPLGRFGLTVSAFSSASADPPTVLVCIHDKSPLRVAILGNRQFCVNVLSSAHQCVAETFSGLSREGKPYEFEPNLWTEGATGSPLLRGAIASVECVLELAVPAASHSILLGRAIAVHRRAAAPLLCTNRSYGRPASLGA
jgi:flavin reductase